MLDKKQGNKGLIILIVVLSIVSLILCGYIFYDKALSNNSSINNSVNLDFDFDELASTLHSSVQKENIVAFISKCVNKVTTTNDPPEIQQSNTTISINTIDTIINKLKTAKSIDKNITYSWLGCPPKSITYYISVNNSNQSEVHLKKVFSLNYANDDDILLVGYNNTGYAFHFNNSKEIKNFIESLK